MPNAALAVGDSGTAADGNSSTAASAADGIAQVACGFVPVAALPDGGVPPAAGGMVEPPHAAAFAAAAGPAAAVPEAFPGSDDMPDAVRASGGWLAPVRVDGLIVLDVFPSAYRWKEPSEGRVQWELGQLKGATAGQRAVRLIKMAYWPKLLERVLREEKARGQRHHARVRETERRRQQRARRDPASVEAEASTAASSSCPAAGGGGALAAGGGCALAAGNGPNGAIGTLSDDVAAAAAVDDEGSDWSWTADVDLTFEEEMFGPDTP